ncbi:MAG: M14 family metallopeptidase [Longimicrobiales bacterium]
MDLRRLSAIVVLMAACTGPGRAQVVPTPASQFGFQVGADRKLANWDQLTAYFGAVARASDRVVLDTLGASTMGMPMVMLTITSPANHARLEELREIQLKLADPRRISSEEELEGLLDRGRTVVLITHGIHATEVGGPQMAARLVHRMATSEDPEILQILDETIFLDIPSLNPDGTQWVTDWYNRWVGTEYEAAPLPWLYHFYTGHDNNRDWYAFTQVETQLTVKKAHNAWHPQVVHDIHQTGSYGARIFFPPFIDPYEPNIDPGIIAGVNQLGSYMAAEVTARGMPGAVIHQRYDAFTPARAYQHYHGGVRILSEAASARIATPIEISPQDLQTGRTGDMTVSSWNFPWPWEGGEWALGDIVDYMEAGALALLKNAARNRSFWLENFYHINRRAVKGWDRWPEAWVIPGGQKNQAGLAYLLRVLTTGDVEVHQSLSDFQADGRRFPLGSFVIPTGQPYGSFAQTMLEIQEYPDLREYPGGPPLRPYDVTAHTLPLLMEVEAVPVESLPPMAISEALGIPEWQFSLPEGLQGPEAPRIGIYRSWQEPMEAGWTRWTWDQHGLAYDTIRDARIREGGLLEDYDVILFQNQDPESIRDGFAPGQLPPEYTGGLGDGGVRALVNFVRAGGRIVAVEEATDFFIEILGLGLSNAVERLPPEEFFIPGSILSVELEEDHPVTRGKGPVTPAWFWRSSRAFDLMDPGLQVIGRYADTNLLLSGWMSGAGYLAGKPAIVEARVGDGSVVLFGFQPDYRGQTVMTWPLLFNALEEAG